MASPNTNLSPRPIREVPLLRSNVRTVRIANLLELPDANFAESIGSSVKFKNPIPRIKKNLNAVQTTTRQI